MATAYKILGQVLPTDTGNNETYQVPPAASAVVSTLSISNVTGSTSTARVFLKKTAFDLTQYSTVAAGGTVFSAAYGNGVYVVGGTNTGTPFLASSTDGYTWTSRTPNVTIQVSTLYWGNGLFVAGGNSGSLSTSSDGITWTTRTSNAGSNNLLASVYGTTLLGTGLYVVGGAAGALVTSPDGTTWTARTSPFSGTGQVNALGYGAGLFVAGGPSGTMMTSLDGTTWTSRTSGFSTNAINGIAYGNGTFVAVGVGGTITRSTNGIAWTASTSGIATELKSIIWTGSQFVVGTNGGTVFLTSPDGITWTQRTPAGSGYAIAYGNSKYVVANNSSSVAVSGSIPTKQNALVYDVSIPANSINSFTIGITLSAGDAVVVQSGTASSLNFTVLGSEIS